MQTLVTGASGFVRQALCYYLLAQGHAVRPPLRSAEYPAAAGQTFLASDGQDLSTPQLIQLMATGINRPARKLPVLVALLQAGGLLPGKCSENDRLLVSLQVDSGHTQARLGWTPPVSVEDGGRDMTRWYAGLRDTQG